MAGAVWMLVAIFLRNINHGFAEHSSFGQLQLNIEPTGLEVSNFMIWPNATVPFHVNSHHYDSEQSLKIMQALSKFSYKTCIKFAPIMDIIGVDHALVFENPEGIRKCNFNRRGHDIEGPHKVVLGYDCLAPPHIDMMIMRSLGFPFEHNRALRDVYIEVQYENIEPDALTLFTKDHPLPLELQSEPYDPNSVMHFDEREFSKNGHRTIIFKNHKFKQNRQGLTEGDIKKIETVYRPYCLKRDRHEKIEICQNFVQDSRKKREVINLRRSLRVNPDIPPLEIEQLLLHAPSEQTIAKLKEFGIETETEEIIQKIYNATRVALKHIKDKLCNITEKPNLRASTLHFTSSKPDSFGLINNIINFVNDTINSLASNLTEFCKTKDEIEIFLRTEHLIKDKETDVVENQESPIKSEIDKKDRKKRETYIKPEDPFDAKSRKYYQDIILESKEYYNDDNKGITKTILMEKGPSDDIMDNKRKIVSLTNNNEEFYADRRWPNGIIPFVISEHVSNEYDINNLRKRINEVNRILKKQTCVRLKEITEREAKDMEDYLVLNTSPDYVTGRVGGRQEFGCTELFSNNEHRQHTAMMVMAMLGFYFEVSRHDRDKYIRVHNRHIRPDKLHHFEKITEDATLDLPYDFESATHPAWKFWRKTAKKGLSAVATFKSKDPDGSVMKRLGQNEKLLSNIDLIKINSVYKCISE